MPIWKEFIQSLFVPAQVVSPQQRRSNASTVGLSTLTRDVLINNPTLRPSSIAQDASLLSRLLVFLQQLFAEDPVMQQIVPDHILQDWSALKRQLARTEQVTESDAARYCCLCLDFVLSILHEIRPATAATFRLREQPMLNLPAHDVKPDVVIDGNDSIARSIHFLLEVKTNADLSNYSHAIASSHVKLDWHNDAAASQAYCSAQPITIITRLVAFMQHHQLPFAFISDGTRYIVLQTRTNNEECFVAVSPITALALSFLPIVLASVLATVGDQSALPSMLAMPAMLGTNLAPPPSTEAPYESQANSVQHGLESSEGCQPTGSSHKRGRSRTVDSAVDSDTSYVDMMFCKEDGTPRSTLSFKLRNLSSNGLSSGIIELHRPIAGSDRGSVFKGAFQGCEVAVKIADEGKESRDSLLAEGELYLMLEELFDSAIPKCFGLFEGSEHVVLVTRWAGEQLEDWSDLALEDRNRVYKKLRAIHKAGILHLDLEPRNVLRLGDELRIIDFSHSQQHKCKGSGCFELVRVRSLLSVSK